MGTFDFEAVSVSDIGGDDSFGDAFGGCGVIMIGAEGDEIGAFDHRDPKGFLNHFYVDFGIGCRFRDHRIGRDDGDLVSEKVCWLLLVGIRIVGAGEMDLQGGATVVFGVGLFLEFGRQGRVRGITGGGEEGEGAEEGEIFES